MHAIRFVTAFIAGAMLYYAAVVLAGGFFAATGAPRSFFAFFGVDHKALALAVFFFISWATPVAVLVTGGMLGLGRLVLGAHRSLWATALAGMFVSFLYWALAPAGALSPGERPQFSLAQALLLSFTFPWWAAANSLAPWVGYAAAFWFTISAQREQSKSGA